jgi:hypothetical protein
VAYHAGDTAVFKDMELIRELYHPELAMLPIGSHYVMSPAEAALACRMLKPRWVIPMHYGTFPVLTGTAEELIDPERGAGDQVIPEAGETVRMRLGCAWLGSRLRSSPGMKNLKFFAINAAHRTPGNAPQESWQVYPERPELVTELRPATASALGGPHLEPGLARRGHPGLSGPSLERLIPLRCRTG